MIVIDRMMAIPQVDTKLSERKPVSAVEIYRGDISKKQIIFTFDGGSGDLSAGEILNTLKKHKVKGTFFLTGTFMTTYPELTKNISLSGHEIFNHTYDHPYLTTVGDDVIVSELRHMDEALRNITGKDSGNYFRPPYGDRDARVLGVAARAGYQSVFWTHDALDWRESEGVTSSDVKYLIMSTLAPGNIYLMHMGDSITGSILDDVFSEIESKGYKIVSLTQGL